MNKVLKYAGIATVVVGGLFEFWLAFFGHVTLCGSGLGPCYGYYILPLWVPFVVLGFGVYLIILSKCVERDNRRRSYEVHGAVPKEVADDYVEALRCYYTNAFTGSVIMARKALQTTCLLKGAKKPRLQDQIEEIMHANIGHFKARRIWGNLDTPTDYLKDITEQDARDILTLTELVVQSIFVMPYELEQWQNEEESRRRNVT